MHLTFFASAGWESWDVPSRPAIPDGMPILADEDLLFEDDGVPRPARAVNRWLCELPSSGAPAAGTWAVYARVLRDWMVFLAGHDIGVFDTRDRLRAALGLYSVHRADGPPGARFTATTWNRHVSVLSSFYRWAVAEGHADAVPFSYAQARARFAGSAREVSVNLARRRTPKRHVAIKYLEPGFAELFVRAQGGALPVPFGVPAGVTKGGKYRTTWIGQRALEAVHRYAGLDRAASVAGSAWRPPARWGTPLVVTEPDAVGGRVNGTRVRWASLGPAERRRLVAPGRAARAAAAGGDDPRAAGWSGDNLRWLLTRLGPASDAEVARWLGRHRSWVTARGGVRAACEELCPAVEVTAACRLLLGMYSGIVPDGIAGLGIGDIDWAGDATVLLGYVKRRTAAGSLTLPRKAVRLLEQWLEHSALAREHAPAQLAGCLWLHCNRFASPRWRGEVYPRAAVSWAAPAGVTVDRRRVRTAYLALRDRGRWHGSPRSAIDPNHTPAVEGDHYLTATTAAQRDLVEQIIEDAQQDMLRRAAPPVVLTAADAAHLAGRYPEVASRLGADDAALAELTGGARDVFTAACADPLPGLHGPPGKPCPARPWVCLLCPLAVFTPRHAANLLRLKAFFARQWRQMPAAQFMAVFGPYAARIGEVLDRYPPELLAALAAEAGDHDGELPLRAEELTGS